MSYWKAAILAISMGATTMMNCSCAPAIQHVPLPAHRRDFKYTSALRNTPRDKIPYTQFEADGCSPEEYQMLEQSKPQQFVIDSTGHRYEATKQGLRICAPPEAQSQKRSPVVQIAQKLVEFLAIFNEDIFGTIAAGNDGCIILDGGDGLPYEKLTSLSIQNATGDIVLGSKRGLILFSRNKFYYFVGKRWLKDDEIIQTLYYDSTILAQIKTGCTKIISNGNYTLEQKERHYQKIMLHHRRKGLVESTRNGLFLPGDNDGLWTSLAIGADTFQYASTKNPEAKVRAKESIDALMTLEKVTGVLGLFARTAFPYDDPMSFDWQNESGKWRSSTTYPGWIWKGDTSMDELVGHFFGYGIYYDLVADEKEKKELREIVNHIVDRLLANHLNIVDIDGQTTKWGRGDPEYTRTELREFFGRGPLAVGTLGILKTAAHITGRKDVGDLYTQLVREYGYALNAINAKILLPSAMNHSDDELMLLSYYNLIRIEENPDLKRLYLIGLDRYWHIERPERNPLWNFMYCALSGNMCDIEDGLETLRDMPLSMKNWRVINSQRSDIVLDAHKDRHGNIQSTTVLPPSERGIMKWNFNPYALDRGGDEDYEEEPTMWLLPYWFGKYRNLF